MQKILIVGDVHLGHPDADGVAFSELINSDDFSKIVLLGDFIDIKHIAATGSWSTSDSIGLNSLYNLKKETVHIAGNHERDFSGFDYFKNYTFSETHQLQFNGYNIFIEHGHRIDEVIFGHLSEIPYHLYSSKDTLSSEKIRQHAMRNARRHPEYGYYFTQAVRARYESPSFPTLAILAHIHKQEDVMFSNLRYINTGAFLKDYNYLVLTMDETQDKIGIHLETFK